jgi:hypothetical protein
MPWREEGNGDEREREITAIAEERAADARG